MLTLSRSDIASALFYAVGYAIVAASPSIYVYAGEHACVPGLRALTDLRHNVTSGKRHLGSVPSQSSLACHC